MYLDSFNIIYDYLMYIILNYVIIYYILNKIKINNINKCTPCSISEASTNCRCIAKCENVRVN